MTQKKPFECLRFASPILKGNGTNLRNDNGSLLLLIIYGAYIFYLVSLELYFFQLPYIKS